MLPMPRSQVPIIRNLCYHFLGLMSGAQTLGLRIGQLTMLSRSPIQYQQHNWVLLRPLLKLGWVTLSRCLLGHQQTESECRRQQQLHRLARKNISGGSQLKKHFPFIGVGKQYKVIRKHVYLVLPMGAEAHKLVNSFESKEYNLFGIVKMKLPHKIWKVKLDMRLVNSNEVMLSYD